MALEHNHQQNSVFKLITDLCDNFASKVPRKANKLSKKLRSKCFEILLSKCHQVAPQEGAVLGDVKDPVCHLLLWQYLLINEYDRADHALKLRECADRFRQCRAYSEEVRDALLYVLLLLRRPPRDNDSIMDKTISDTYINSAMLNNNHYNFKLPTALVCCRSTYSNESFYLRPKSRAASAHRSANALAKPHCGCINSSNFISCRSSLNSTNENSNSYLEKDSSDESIWDLAIKMPFSRLRKWENYGEFEPDKEPPFLSELGNKSYLWNEMLISFDFRNRSDVRLHRITNSDLVKDIKYLLVGIESKTFKFKLCEEQFCLTEGVYVEDITLKSLEGFCKDFLFCGNCYRFLDNISKYTKYKYQQCAHIFHEFCESIRRYLSYYRVVVFAVSDNTTLLALHQKISLLKQHLSMLTSICKLVPFEDNGFLSGIKLLNALYRELFNLTDKNVVMVFYSILVPCCQLYFRHFLQQWLFDGCVNDTHNEFFIVPNLRYISTRGRTYWTRSFAICDDLVPDFLREIKNDVLACGKAVNLLKLCLPNSPLCMYLLGRKSDLMTCCLSRNQLVALEHNMNYYYLRASRVCGTNFSLAEVIERMQDENNPELLALIAKKRAATLERIRLERQKLADENMNRKRKAMAELKQQYEEALQAKRSQTLLELEREISLMETNMNLQNMRDELIEDEAKTLLSYYGSLIEASEEKRKKIKQRIDKLKALNLCDSDEKFVQHDETKTTSSSLLIDDEQNEADETNAGLSDSVQSFHSLDTLNANSQQILDVDTRKIDAKDDEINKNVVTDEITDNNQTREKNVADTAYENFEIAKRNRARVMSTEFGFMYEPLKQEITKESLSDTTLTEAQRNKLKVLSSEYGIYKIIKSSTDLNSTKNPTASLDNENFVNRNVEIGDTTKIEDKKQQEAKIDDKKKQHLRLDVENCRNSDDNEEKPTPMSIDSTPLTENSPKVEDSITKLFLKIEKQFDTPMTACTTAATNFTDEGFNFGPPRVSEQTVLIPKVDGFKSTTVAKDISKEDTKTLTNSSMKIFLQQSVLIPVVMQTRLANCELLKFFVKDLKYLDHLVNLKNYFFMQDGEFSKNITEGLFEKLYEVKFPVELINCRALQMIIRKALDSSCKCEANVGLLSFKINNLPDFFELGDPGVLSCLSLTYKVSWPLNILLPADTIEKYDEVFKYLLKLQRVSWVQKKIFEGMKMLAKETGNNVIFLKSSPHYRRLHQCRHVMTHFIQTLQNYTIEEVLQTSWKMFESNLKNAADLDQLYSAHTSYVKNILFMCLLNKKSAPVMKVIEKVFIVMLKFYDYLRSFNWRLEDGLYVHPNFDKLNSLFMNFEEFVAYLFKLGQKLVLTGYQPHLLQLLDMLNVNGYYSNKNAPP